MSILTLIRKIISPLLFLNIVNRYKGRSSLIKIKAAQAYVLGVKKARILLIGFVFVLFSFVLLGSGLSLVHTALFTYSLWSYQVKFIMALVLGVAEFLIAVMILMRLFKEENWVKFCGIKDVINSVVDGKSVKAKEGAGSDEIKTNAKEYA